jgi:3-hydroxyisobutyrate dehydrogenase-like beta-hydroxyacid dehydrogenase
MRRADHVRNIITLNLMEAVGEAQVFAEHTGLGTTAIEELITESFGGVAGGYSKRYVASIVRYAETYLSLFRLTSGIHPTPR